MTSAEHPKPSTSADETRWLSPEELAVWMKLSMVLVRLPQELDAQLQREAGLSWFEYLVLAGLSEAPDRTMRMSRLALLTNGSLSRLSHVVSRLERRGWVERQPCPTDGRYTNATLTEAGWGKVVATAPGHVAAVRHFVTDALQPGQLDSIGGVVDRLADRLLPPDEPGCAAP